MESSLQLFDVIKAIYQKRKTLLIVLIVSGIVGSAVAMLLPVYYKSTTIFYAANPGMNDRQNLFREQAGNLPIEYFGSEKDVDRVLQICKSGNINGYIVNKYHLAQHYKIDTTSPYYHTMVSEEFKENSQMVRNELGAIEITIFDTDAKMAADMANDIVHTVDNINKSFFAEQNQKGIRLMEDNIKTKTAQISHLNDTLAQLRRGSNQDLISTYAAQQKAAVKDLNKLNGLYEQYKAAAGNEFSTVNVIEPAYAAERKSKPVRWLIVVSIVLVSFCVSVIFLLLKERWASIKKELA
ncbi:MAG: hypothetical protein RL138_566 [Bacteroidota bacterium]|jgi:uncharacterized protein involved in exopolysaccharide biosynthesis